MLELKNIIKVYETGDLVQTALNGVSLSFRPCEFASILGPSGSGKTTLLNIIGGLDKYTSGDLVINNISTKKYKDSDWDSYRNHRIGFVFQSYNLIGHQTVLKNVTLALTLSGISKKEGIEKAKKALESVGLEDHMYKKPNQLSGGQMQRVAIARALVNDPDILLADEPTGALDSETSVQIMNILKKVAENKLVIMVTHNPDLAREYSSRIITLKDGQITSDTNPYKSKETIEENNELKKTKTKKTSMSFLTALGLSFNNLMTKKGRTILAAFAGSIGIIGIALILSLSTGFQNYIDKLQEDTLSSYPLTITNEAADITGMLLSMVSGERDDIESNKVIEKQYVSSMFSNISANDLKSFKGYIESHYSYINDDISSIKYSYSVDPLIYTKNPKGDLEQVNPNTIFSSLYGNMGISSLYSSYTSIFSQMIDDRETLDEQYDILEGRWPEQFDEMVIVLPEPHGIPDMLIYFLGLKDIQELYDIITASMSGDTVEVNTSDPMEFTYEDLMNIELKLIKQTDTYKYNDKYDIYEDMSEDEEYMKKLYSKGLKLRIVGVVCAKEGTTSMALNPGVAYTSKLIDYVIKEAEKTSIVKKQLNDRNVDVFSNTRFDSKEKKNDLDFEDMISVDEDMLASAFNVKIDENDIKNMTTGYMTDISSSITTDISPAKEELTSSINKLASGLLKYYIENPKETVDNPYIPGEKLAVIHLSDVEDVVKEYMNLSDTKKIISSLENKFVIPSNVYESTFTPLLQGLLSGYITVYNNMDKSFTTDETNMGAVVIETSIKDTVDNFMNQAIIITTVEMLSGKMTEAVMQKDILTKVGELTTKLMMSLSNAFDVSPEKIASAFKFDLSEDELKRLMSAMMNNSDTGGNADTNLISLGYQDKESPTMMSIYFNSFDSKENFLAFIDSYNDLMESKGEDDKVINYTDTTGILMSSVKKIVNSVSYVLIAFVSISLVVSSIMIGIITYISVLERTKEIGVLRAIGASKRNISTIFNAETTIIGLLSGLFGVGITCSLIPLINYLIHHFTDNYNINAVLGFNPALLLVTLSIFLTIIGGLIPSKKASKQDPVVALRSE